MEYLGKIIDVYDVCGKGYILHLVQDTNKGFSVGDFISLKVNNKIVTYTVKGIEVFTKLTYPPIKCKDVGILIGNVNNSGKNELDFVKKLFAHKSISKDLRIPVYISNKNHGTVKQN